MEISFFEHECNLSRLERKAKRLWIALIIAVVLLGGSNMAWLVFGLMG